jgi:hypothetical protein
MDTKTHNPGANVPKQTNEEPRGDRGRGDRTWAPKTGKQGISNRPGDMTRPLRGASAEQRTLSHDDVLEDEVEREENRHLENDVQQDVEGRARRRTAARLASKRVQD